MIDPVDLQDYIRTGATRCQPGTDEALSDKHGKIIVFLKYIRPLPSLLMQTTLKAISTSTEVHDLPGMLVQANP